MPAVYAHYRFGQAVLARLPEGEQAVASAGKELYDIGLHGPDILFYYRPFSGNPVNRMGNRAHTMPGKLYFSRMWDILARQAEPGPALAYLYGFLCHFTLDCSCHGYINEMDRTSPHSHSEIETELDRYFMIADGKDPMRYHPTGHLHPSEENARIIAPFFPGVSIREVRESLHTMVGIENLWVASNPVKRGVVVASLKLAGQYENRKGLLRPYEAPSGCVGLLPPVIEMYERAVPRAVRLIASFTRMAGGGEPWDPCYDLPFDPQSARQAPADN